MNPRTLWLVSPLALLALAGPGTSQHDGNGNAKAHAEANATAQGGECRTSTHRVVVVNGKTVVDERTENGVPVGPAGGRPGGNGAAPLQPRLPMPQLGGTSAEEMMRQMQEEVRRQMEQQQRATPPLPPKPPATPTRPPAAPPTGQKTPRRA
jgi:hypothetical protein